MPVHSITTDALSGGRPRSIEEVRSWCAFLESGGILYFPKTPVPIPDADLQILMGGRQSSSRHHKNISYKPDRGCVGGVDTKTLGDGELEQLCAVMRRYSASVSEFLAGFLVPYEGRWRLDYASYRPVEEHGRTLPLHHRNDLLHTDAFPTRPTRGWRILRFFHNIHPTRTRDWAVGEPFDRVVGLFTPGKLAVPRADGPVRRSVKRLSQSIGAARLIPQLKRTPYDAFMVRLHNAMKEDEQFQHRCAREFIQFAPGSSWMVFTETTAHAVLGGQYALEQTFLVDPAAMVTPESAPIAMLERMAGVRLI